MKKSRLIGALCASFCFMNVFFTPVHAIGVSGQGTWETTLQPRDLDGNPSTIEAYYDTDLDITWLANANLAVTNTFGVTGISIYGQMDWSTANAWIAAMNTTGGTGYLGYNDWRLPTVTDTATPGCDFAYAGAECGFNVDTSTGEMAHMFYTTLGDKAVYDTSGNLQSGFGLSNTGPFINLVSSGYWYGTEYAGYAPDTSNAWYFHFYTGYQNFIGKAWDLDLAWPVRDGDVGAVIVPITIDIKPGSTENAINPGSKGRLTVAILTTEDFDASKVDASTVQFGPGAAKPVHYALEDVDGNTDWDLVLHFNTQDIGIICGETEAAISGQTFDGVEIRGTDSIKTVGCKN